MKLDVSRITCLTGCCISSEDGESVSYGDYKDLYDKYSELVQAIDEKMVVAGIGVFDREDCPRAAINKLEVYYQDLGSYFAINSDNRC